MNLLTLGPYYRPIILPTIVRERTLTEYLTDWFAGNNSYRSKVRRSLEDTLSYRYHAYRTRTPPLVIDGMTACSFSYTMIDKVQYVEVTEPHLIYQLNRLEGAISGPHSVYITVIDYPLSPELSGLTTILWRHADKATGVKSYLDGHTPVILKNDIIKAMKEGKFR